MPDPPDPRADLRKSTDLDVPAHAPGAGMRSRFFAEAAAVLSSSLEPGTILGSFARLAVERFCDACFVVLRDPDGSLKTAAFADRDRPLAPLQAASQLREDGAVERVLQSGQPILEREMFDDAIPGASSVIVVPLLVKDVAIGAITFVSHDCTRSYDSFDLEIAAAAARQTALALQNARRFDRERRTGQRFAFVARLTNELLASPVSSTSLQRLVEAAVGPAADLAMILLLQPDGAIRVEGIAHRDPALRSRLGSLRGHHIFARESERLIATRMQRRRPYTLNGITAETIAQTVRPYALSTVLCARPYSAVTVPLFAGDTTFGAFVAYSCDPNETYSSSDSELFGEIGRRVSLALEHARSLERERRLAQTLQEATLPAQLPAIEGARLSTVYAPASSDAQVGGDWYDAFELPDRRVLLTVGDVTGSGLQAAVIMGKLRHSLNVIAMYEPDPAKILDAAEHVMLQRYPEAIATAFVAIFDPVRRRIVYANAGHPYPLLRLGDGTVEHLRAGGLPIGLRALGEPVPSRSRSLHDVGLLTFYTDGLVEAKRDLDEGERTLRSVVSTEASLFVRSPASLIAAICLRDGSLDDVALMVLTFSRSAAWSFDAEDADAAHASRCEFVEELRRTACGDSDLAAAELIFGELIGNVLRHAPGPIDVALEWKGGDGILHVIDRGAGFAGRPAFKVDPMSEAGRGLWLVQEFGRGLRVEPLPGFGNHVRVVLPVVVRSMASA